MKRLRAVLLFTAVLLVSCDHHKPANQAQTEAGRAAVAQSDSELTGLPAPQTNGTAKSAAPRVQVASETPTGTVSVPADTAPPTNTDSSSTVAAPQVAASTTPPPDQPPPIAPKIDDSSMSRLSISPSNPEPATNPSPLSDDATSQEQVVVLDTSFGRIVIELDSSAAPLTCDNFRKLVADGFYNHTVFHRVIPNFIIQGGDPNSIASNRASYGQGNPGYTVPAEIKLTHDVGAVAMARLPDSVNPKRESNGSQFYICVEACPSLDAKYTVFGHVIKGMDVVNKISTQPRDARDNPKERIEMQASLETKSKAIAADGANP